MKKLQVIPLANKKNEQVLQDVRMTPQERWIRMWELIEMSIAFSPSRQLKVVDENDSFITLKRNHATI